MDNSNPWPRRVLWLVLSALVTGVTFLVIAAILRFIREEPVDMWWLESPFKALFLIGFIGACSLPSLVAYAFVMLLLAKRRHASLLASFVIGGLFGLTSFAIVGWMFGVSIPDVFDATAGFALGAIPTLLYWWFAVRKERQMAETQARDSAAIAAME
jgi:hypothetical protein